MLRSPIANGLLALALAAVLLGTTLIQRAPPLSAVDDFNRANENPLSGGGNWGGSIDTDETSVLEIETNAVLPSVSATVSAYWATATFSSPFAQITAADNTGATGNWVGITLVYSGVNTATPSGYHCRVFQAGSGGNTDVWRLYRLDTGTLTELGTEVANALVDGGSLRCAHTAGVLTLEECTPTCTTHRSEADATYSGAAHVGIALSTRNMILDDFSGGGL